MANCTTFASRISKSSRYIRWFVTYFKKKDSFDSSASKLNIDIAFTYLV